MSNNHSGLEKKQTLLQEYFHLIADLKKERKELNAKIEKVETKFAELIESGTDPAQLAMFDNMDEFLTAKAAA